jgi:hypothetical protein
MEVFLSHQITIGQQFSLCMKYVLGEAFVFSISFFNVKTEILGKEV